MIWPHLSVLLASLLLVTMGYWRRRQSRRLTSWEKISSSIRSNSEIEQAVDRFRWKSEVTVEMNEIWEVISGPSGLANIYHNAGVYAKLADYASQHTSNIPDDVIEEIYTEATQIRVMVVFALASYLTLRTVSSRVNTFRAVQLYSGMTKRLTDLFQESCPTLFPKLMEVM